MERKLILLADDDTDDTDLFCEALENIDPDFDCRFAGNGSELLKTLAELDRDPDLIFLDLNMPVMNGWQCLKVLKENEHYRRIPVIMISTSSHEKEIKMAAELGALCYFVKPSNFDDLTHILDIITSNLGEGLKSAMVKLQESGTGLIFV